MKLKMMLDKCYNKYNSQTDETNPDRNLDYREEVAMIVEEAITCNVDFTTIGEALKTLKELD